VSGLVIIGASYAGIQAALSARDAGYGEPVTVVSDEKSLPYQRPPLSKDFLLGEASEQNLVLRDDAFFASRRIDLLLDRRAVEIDRTARQVALADGARLAFDKLVIASGSRARGYRSVGPNWMGFATFDRSQMPLISKRGSFRRTRLSSSAAVSLDSRSLRRRRGSAKRSR
jgi:NADPH-dependent 2,4-dienoyl-CoA reductase/sulfur reductase-like enzyme